MKGTNKINLNKATVIAAVQMYLDSQFAPGKSPVVENIEVKDHYEFDCIATVNSDCDRPGPQPGDTPFTSAPAELRDAVAKVRDAHKIKTTAVECGR